MKRFDDDSILLTKEEIQTIRKMNRVLISFAQKSQEGKYALKDYDFIRGTKFPGVL